MKKTIFFLLILIAANANAQVNDYTVTMEGIGAIKIDMKQDELEKLLNKKIPLTNPWDTVSGAWYDSAKIKYKGIDLRIEFQRTYTAENSFYMRIIAMQTSSPLCKTRSGICIGSDKLKIIAAYEDNTLIVTKEAIIVRDNDEERMIIFNMINKKVVSVEIATYFNDAE
ncbi:MAG: hypothetical protein JJE22_11540 [Bacteroidia bacterium]|nr:hypothetical protein [Bacteroidia bacterium]